jgi:hypothetical protein
VIVEQHIDSHQEFDAAGLFATLNSRKQAACQGVWASVVFPATRVARACHPGKQASLTVVSHNFSACNEIPNPRLAFLFWSSECMGDTSCNAELDFVKPLVDQSQ